MQQFGIRITLPETSTLCRDHLLGKNWEGFRWFSTEEEREAALKEMSKQPGNYRKGDEIQQILERIER